MILEKHYHEELANIIMNEPVFPGNVISHKTANECVKRGWVKRNENGDFAATPGGKAAMTGILALRRIGGLTEDGKLKE